MNQVEINTRIAELEQQLSTLPVGTLVYKTIVGKKQPYLQWTENGKSKSKYIKVNERELILAQVELRKKIVSELKELKHLASYTQAFSTLYAQNFKTNITIGTGLINMIQNVSDFQKRDCFDILFRYLHGTSFGKVCLLYGLRRTGKTTLLLQAISELSDEERARTAYIKIQPRNTMADIDYDLRKLSELNYKYIFIDEVTLMSDFIDSAALFSDVYAMMGMKIVLSGTDSLGFWFALDQELYDRAYTIHTTFISYKEHSRLLGNENIDEYIRYGGTLRAGETDFDNRDLLSPDACFRDDESTRRYIDTAICQNIQHSLACCESGGHFRHLQSLYQAGELTSAINRIIEDMNHAFLIQTLIKDFKSHDLGSAAQILRKQDSTRILDNIDKQAVTTKLMELLDIRNKENLSIGITDTHVEEIKEYLKALELIIDCPTETTQVSATPLERVLFTQPGMRYCQAQALVHSLLKDPLFASASELEKKLATDKILEDVRGRMMEEIILLETTKALPKHKRAFKLLLARGEFDMVIYDSEENSCELYEIKHSSKIVVEQCHILLDNERLTETKRRFGSISKRCILYCGDDYDLENGILYRNAETYLKNL